jgi:hypothetical protein
VIWLNPRLLFALAALAAPLVIHILVQRRAERIPFPTLRFLTPTRLAAIRRHVLEDAGLLAVRLAILAAAVAALAGPLAVTPLRRQAWERRVVRATVVDESLTTVERGSDARGVAVYRSQEFAGPSLPDGIHRAVAWLEQAPPARREIVVVSPLAIGAVDVADVAEIPASIGIRFERRGELPRTRTVSGGRLIGAGVATIARELTFTGAQTIVRDVPAAEPASWPIDAVHAPEAKAAIDAAKVAVLEQRVWAPAPARRVRVVIGAATATGAVSDAAALSLPWMADAAAHIARDAELRTAASRVANGLADPRFAAPPWQMLASAADGHPLVVAAGGSAEDSSTVKRPVLLVVSAAGAGDIATPLLMRSIAGGVAAIPDLQHAEVLPIADAQLRQWSRPAAPPAIPTADALRHQDVDDDRRWLWFGVLCLMGVEAWMRRVRDTARHEDRGREREPARVA